MPSPTMVDLDCTSYNSYVYNCYLYLGFLRTVDPLDNGHVIIMHYCFPAFIAWEVVHIYYYIGS